MTKIEDQLFVGEEEIFPGEEQVIASFGEDELWQIPRPSPQQERGIFDDTENLNLGMQSPSVEGISGTPLEMFWQENQIFVENHPSYQSDAMVSSIENSYVYGEEVGSPLKELPWENNEKEPSSFLQSVFHFGEHIFENGTEDAGDFQMSSAFSNQDVFESGGSLQGKKEVHIHNEIPAIHIEFSGAIDQSVDIDILMRDMQKQIKEEMESNTDFVYHY